MDKNTLSGAYVLNALDPHERAGFEQHLAESEATRNEVTELADTAVVLGLAVDPVEPSAALRSSVLDAIARTPQLPREQASVDAVRPADSPSPAPVRHLQPAQAAALAADDGTGGAEHRARVRWFQKPVGLVAAAAAAVGLVFGGVALGQSLAAPSPQELEASSFAQLVAAPDVESIAQTLEGGGTATLYYSEELGRSAVAWKDLAQLSDDEVYQLWYIGDEAVPAGLFEADAAESFAVLEGTMRPGLQVGITIEPAGGSAQPNLDQLVTVFETA